MHLLVANAHPYTLVVKGRLRANVARFAARPENLESIMRTTIHLVFCSLLAAGIALSGGCAGTNRYQSYGERTTLADSAAVPVAKVVKTPESYVGKKILVGGVVTEVCQPKGCWIKVAETPESAEALFVKFTCPVDGRLIPLDAVGRRAWVEGELELEEVSQDDARHYAEDSGASAEEIARIVGPQKRLRMKSPAARIAMPAAGASEGQSG